MTTLMIPEHNNETQGLTMEQKSVWLLNKDYSSLKFPVDGRHVGLEGIHRIKTAAAFVKLGGGTDSADLPISFDQYDLVIVKGTLGCSTGKVMFSLSDNESVVKFRVDIVGHCTHMTMQLCVKPYSASYAVRKDISIHPSFDSGKPELPKNWGVAHKTRLLASEKTSKALGLEACEMTDDEMAHLCDFTKLTHLDLGYNKGITDEGLVHLSHMLKLKKLSLHGCSCITDAGLIHLRPLMKLGRIQDLSLSGTGITFVGVSMLREWAGGRYNSDMIGHSLVKVKEYDGIPTPSEIRKSQVLHQVREAGVGLTELVMDYRDGDTRYSSGDVRSLIQALENHDTMPSSPLKKVAMPSNFCMDGLDWGADVFGLEKLTPLLWKAVAQLPSAVHLRFECPIGQLVSVPMTKYLPWIRNHDGLTHLDLNVGGDLMNYGTWQRRGDPTEAQEKQIFFDIFRRTTNLEELHLRWRLTDAAHSQKTQEALSTLIDILCTYERLTTLHLESFVYISLLVPFFSGTMIQKICRMKKLRHLKLSGMQLTDECAAVFANELAMNTSLKSVDFWIPWDARDCKKDDFSVNGLQILRAMMEKQMNITTLSIHDIHEDEYIHFSSMCDGEVFVPDFKTAPKRTGTIETQEAILSLRGVTVDNRDIDSSESASSFGGSFDGSIGGSIGSFDCSFDDGSESDSSSDKEYERQVAAQNEQRKQHEAKRKYLQAKIMSFCRLNASGRHRIEDGTMGCREWVDLLGIVSHDLDAVRWILLQDPSRIEHV